MSGQKYIASRRRDEREREKPTNGWKVNLNLPSILKMGMPLETA